MMKFKPNLWRRQVIVLFVFLLWVTDAAAQRVGNVVVHGFGGWAYGKTNNENRFLMGTQDGSFEAVNFSLNLSATPFKQLTLAIQPGYAESIDGNSVGLDYAFAQWYYSDALMIRAGKVKAPFMLATEVYQVGTIRPFFSLPQGVYQQLAAEAYKGAGVTGSFYLGSSWEMQYDVYGGKLSLLPNRYLNAQTFQFDLVTPEVNDLMGGRLLVQTPITGLHAAVSSFAGDFDFIGQENLNDHYLLFAASAEYSSNRWWLRSEYLTQQDSPEIKFDVIYLETAYHLTPHWQAAVRYEYAEFDVRSLASVLIPKSIYDHQEISLGLNYWLSPNLVAKVSYHIVEGNRLAFPETVEDYMQSLQRGSFTERTNLILVGVQFSF